MVKRSLQLSYLESFFSSLMLGAGEAFFAAYALSQGLGELLAGFVVGLPMMMGAALQTATPTLFRRFARPKRWVVLMAFLQALTLFALMLTTLEPTGPWTIFFLIGLYWAFFYAGGSVWNYWMGFVVPIEKRSEFFSRRLRLTQIGIITGLLLAGVFLNEGDAKNLGAKAYLLPFLIAFLARCFAIYMMGAQMPIAYETVKEKFTLNVRQFFRETAAIFAQNPRARGDLTFLFLFNVMIYISSPFVTPFMLAKLKFGYLSFMAAQIALFLGKIVSLSFSQRWIDRFGVRRVLFWGALGMSPLPVCWLIIQHTTWAVILQALSGFAWGLFEVALGLVLFSELPHKDKIQLLTWNNFFQTAAILAGTLIGGKILSQYDEMVFGYFVIFVAGALLRTFLVLAYRPRIVPEPSAFSRDSL